MYSKCMKRKSKESKHVFRENHLITKKDKGPKILKTTRKQLPNGSSKFLHINNYTCELK